MKVRARIVFELPNQRMDFVAPSIEPLLGLSGKWLYGWTVEQVIRDFKLERFKLNMVDVGACVGSWGIRMAHRYPKASVLCIEPIKESYECLVYNSRNFKNLKTINCAVDEKDGILELGFPDLKEFMETHNTEELWNNYGVVSAFYRDGGYKESAEAHPLDNLVGNVDFLKIDVEGMEMRVLKGATRILTEDKPCIQIELREKNQDRAGRTIEEIDEYIKSFGYFRFRQDKDDVDKIYFPRQGREFHIE